MLQLGELLSLRKDVREGRQEEGLGGVSKADNPSGVFLFLLRPRPTYSGIVEDPQPSLLRFIGCRRGLSSWLLPGRMR